MEAKGRTARPGGHDEQQRYFEVESFFLESFFLFSFFMFIFLTTTTTATVDLFEREKPFLK
jgi:hypothetical protein